MLFQDLQYALRQLRKSPAFTALAVGTLALGIAANTTIISWINSTLFNPIPGVRSTSNMLTLQRGERSEHASPPFSYLDYADLRDGSKTLSGLLAYHDDYVALTGDGRPQRIYGALTSANYFEVMGVKPILGRTLLASSANERAGSPEVVLGYDLWQNRFAGDPSIIGQTTQINLHTYTIVGVAPRGFQGCKSGLRTELWIPLGMDRQVWGSTRIEDRSLSWLNVLGVLRPGADHRQVEIELNLLMQRLADRYPDSHKGANQISTDPLWRSPFGANVYFYGSLPILLALAAVLLLLACANVANLLLVRSVGRRREFAIRLSMGASRWQLVRQLMVENLLLALAGGGVALAITFWTARTLGSFLPFTTLPININASVDGTVTLVTILIAAVTSVVAGVVPALRASSLSPAAVLKDEALNTSGGLHKSRLASGLVIMQVALSLTLLVCAGLFVRSLNKAQEADLGFDPDHVYLASFDLDPLGYPNAKALELDRQILARVKSLPGVQSATLADFSPLSFTIHSEGVLPEGYIPRPHESIEVDRGIVGPGYLQTLRTPVLAGRDFTDADNAETQRVVVVNQAFANRYWPGQDAIGKRVQISGRWSSVVGVASNGKYRRLTYDSAPLFLTPLAQRYEDLVTLHVRVDGDPMAYSAAIDKAVHDLSPDLPLFNVTTLKTNMKIGNVFERIVVVFAGSFGLLAMLLAAVGIYGVVAYSTKQRTHEIGIRMALGAARGDVFRQILRQGLRLTLTGLAVGLAVSFAFTRLLRGLLFGVGTTDWITFAAVSISLCIVALVACYVPARRAAYVEPMQALRTE
ncbi:MAG: ABC transporter permease [Terracidiphilus sp.]|jgi:predicted permease